MDEVEVKNWKDITSLNVSSLLVYCESHQLQVPVEPDKRSLLLLIRKERKYEDSGDSLSTCSDDSLFRSGGLFEEKSNKERLKRWWTKKHLQKGKGSKTRTSTIRPRPKKSRMSVKGSPRVNVKAKSELHARKQQFFEEAQYQIPVIIEKWKQDKRSPEVKLHLSAQEDGSDQWEESLVIDDEKSESENEKSIHEDDMICGGADTSLEDISIIEQVNTQAEDVENDVVADNTSNEAGNRGLTVDSAVIVQEDLEQSLLEDNVSEEEELCDTVLPPVTQVKSLIQNDARLFLIQSKGSFEQSSEHFEIPSLFNMTKANGAEPSETPEQAEEQPMNQDECAHGDSDLSESPEETEEEKMHAIKSTWLVGSKLEVFSQSTGEWYKGSILSIDTDEEGEWLCVSYGENPSKQKQIQRFSVNVRPSMVDTEAGAENEESPDDKEASPRESQSALTEEEAEDKVRIDWNVGASLQVFSQSTGEWSDGKILSVDIDEEGEWLTVSYGPEFGKQKQIQRWNANIRPDQDDIDAILEEDAQSRIEVSEVEVSPKSNSAETRADVIEKVRKSWKRGSRLEVFSQSTAKWFSGMILSIDNDAEGEWLTVSYDNQKQKQIQRFNANVRPLESDITKMETSPSSKPLLQRVESPKTPTSDPDLVKNPWSALGTANLHQTNPFMSGAFSLLTRVVGNLRRKELLQSSKAEFLRLQILNFKEMLSEEQGKLDQLNILLKSRPGTKRRDSIVQDSEKEDDDYVEKMKSHLRRVSESNSHTC